MCIPTPLLTRSLLLTFLYSVHSMLCHKVREISKLRYESFWMKSTGLVEWLKTAKLLFKHAQFATVQHGE
jgi:hypothetical protein